MSIYFLLRIGWQAALVLWPVTILAGTALFRLCILGPRVRCSGTLRGLSALVPGDIVLLGKESPAHDWPLQLTNVMTDKIENRFWTGAGIYKGDGLIWEAGPAGVRERPLKEYAAEGYLFRAFRHRYVNPGQSLAAVDDFCRVSQGHPYGAAGMFYYQLATLTPAGFQFVFREPKVDAFFHITHVFFPAELVIDALDCAGAPLTGFDAWRIKPADFIHNPLLVEIKDTDLLKQDAAATPAAAEAGSSEQGENVNHESRD